MVPDWNDSASPHTSVVGPGSETSEPSIFLKRKEPLSLVISLPVFDCLLPSVCSMSLSALGVPPHCCFELSGNWNSGSCTKASWRCQLAANMPKVLINWQQGRLTLQWIEMQQGRQVRVKAGNWQIGCWEKCMYLTCGFHHLLAQSLMFSFHTWRDTPGLIHILLRQVFLNIIFGCCKWMVWGNPPNLFGIHTLRYRLPFN